MGAGFAVAVDVATGHAAVGSVAAGYALAVPVTIYVLGTWVLHDLPRPMPRWRMALGPLAATLVLLAPWTPTPPLSIGLVLSALVAARIAGMRQEGEASKAD